MNGADVSRHEHEGTSRGFLGPDPRVPLAMWLAWAARAAMGWICAVPLIATVAASGNLSGPSGDHVLFAPESLWLAELVRRDGSALMASARAAALLFALATALRTLTTLALFLTVVEARSWQALGAAALRLAPRWLTVGVTECVLRGLLAVALVIGVGVLGESSWSANEALRSAPVFALLLVGAALSAMLGVGCDSLRVLIARDERPVPLRGLLASLRRLPGSARFRLFAAYLAFAGAGTLALALGARASETIDVSHAGGWRVLAVFALHQATLLALTWLQLKWIRRLCAELGTE